MRRVFVASDSARAIDALQALAAAAPSHQTAAHGELHFPRFEVLTFSEMGAPLHVASVKAVNSTSEVDIDHVVFDWAAFVYAPAGALAVALPSSFASSAVCMFTPWRAFNVYRPARNSSIRCETPEAHGAPRVPTRRHPCAIEVLPKIVWSMW